MLPPTRRAVEALKEAGLERTQFRTKTSWRQSSKGYGETTITLLCSYAQIAPSILKLAQSFKVIVTIFDGIPAHVSIEIASEIGLFKSEHGKTEPVKEIPMNGSYKQLSFAEML